MKMKNMKLLTAALLAVVVLATGCSSLMCGKTQTVNIHTKPNGVNVVVYDRFDDVIFRGTTPCDVTLNRGNDDKSAGRYRVALSLDGYESQDVYLAGKVNRAYFANVLFANLPGLAVVDPLTGAMWTLTPESVTGEMQSQE